MSRAWIHVLALTGLYGASQPSVTDIIRKSVANTQADWNAAPQYNFTERDVVTKSRRTMKTFRVTMIDGSPYNELIAQNGEPLGPADAAAQQRKLQQETARRQRETPAQRQARTAQYNRERHQDNALLQQMLAAMNYQLVGEETIDGHRCYVLEGTPKPDYRPISRDTRVLKGMRGKMWVDEQTCQWVKVQAEVFRPVAFGLFIARVEPGTEFTLEQQPVSGGIWLPSHFSMQVKASVLRYWQHNSSESDTYSKYTPASSR